MEDDSPERIAVGPHLVTILPPNMLLVDFGSPLDGSQAGRILDLMWQTGSRRGPLKVLMDITQVTNVPRGVRESIRTRNTESTTAALAFVGARFGVRVAIDMIIAAVRILRPDVPVYPHGFFGRKEEALTWLRAAPSVPRRANDPPKGSL
ncbi:hypothetical protein [Polyangium sp. 15x6]|uniref:hypothetical protein n=1 Tax=Polyangium sp. 15x6 TaxID=3042687 RepID=UPI00249C0D54|nr:hypothetical protein [Polyangium sp. 15x6]MDI3288072.1 hypothetical protein [Polyangium sp. 15x6]